MWVGLPSVFSMTNLLTALVLWLHLTLGVVLSKTLFGFHSFYLARELELKISIFGEIEIVFSMTKLLTALVLWLHLTLGTVFLVSFGRKRPWIATTLDSSKGVSEESIGTEHKHQYVPCASFLSKERSKKGVRIFCMVHLSSKFKILLLMCVWFNWI